MEAGPFGPWRQVGAASDVDPGPAEERTSGWRTGTAIDRYTPIYIALNRQTHAPIGPAEARGMDLTVVAAMLGVGRDDWADWAAEMRAGRKQAMESGERWEWPD